MAEVTLYKFQPDVMKREILEKIFVGKKRKRLLRSLLKELENAIESGTPTHYLIVGARGIGKTHFITLLYYRLGEKAKNALLVKLSEEEFSVYRVSDLMLRILQTLSKGKIDLSKFEKMSDDDVVAASLEELKGLGKIIVLFVENLNQIISEQMNEREVKRLRSLLQNENRFIVMATAPLIFPQVSAHEAPFFNFFDVIYLFELTKGELKELLKKIAKIEKNNKFLRRLGELEHKIDAIATLTGGNPRIAILLYNLTGKGKMLDVENTFFKILDENTPYYQDIFRMLSGGQRKIFDSLISIGRPATPKEIATKTRLNRAVVNSQMRRLEKDGYVISHKMGRTTKYEVRERLFRLWRELRREPFGRQRLSILIEFLELWYSFEERKEMLLKCFKHINEPADKQILKEASYWFSSLPPEHKEEVLPTLIKESYKRGRMQTVDDLMHDEEMKRKVMTAKIDFFLKNGKYEELLESMDQITTRYNSAELWNVKAMVLWLLGRHEESLEASSKALELDPKNVETWNLKAAALDSLGRYEEALEASSKALELDPKNVRAWNLKTAVLGSLGRYEEALEASSKALELDPKNVRAWNLKAVGLGNLGKYEEALESISEAIELDPNNAFAWTVKAMAFRDLGRYEEALEASSKALELDPKNVRAWNLKTAVLGSLGRYEEALEASSKALELDPKNVETWVERGWALARLNRFKDGSDAFSKAAELTSKTPLRTYYRSLATLLSGSFYLEESLNEFVNRNEGNATKDLTLAINLLSNLMGEEVKEMANGLLTQFLMELVNSRNVEVLEIAIKLMFESKKEYKDLFMPFSVALEIVKTKDTSKYYDVQIEIREVVADIVKRLTGSSSLLPEKYK